MISDVTSYNLVLYTYFQSMDTLYASCSNGNDVTDTINYVSVTVTVTRRCYDAHLCILSMQVYQAQIYRLDMCIVLYVRAQCYFLSMSAEAMDCYTNANCVVLS